MNDLDRRIEKSLRVAHEALALQGKLPSADRLQAAYAAFRSHFGPDQLKALDGSALLNAMHTHGNKESLVYWLEFKNDEEFPGPTFGSIAGGSAHKFGLFRRKETQQWVVGSPKNDKDVSENDAIIIARKHRDQLLAGARLLDALPMGSSDAAYLALQTALEEQAPDICRLAWSHKYWSLLFPDKIDDFHNERWQRYNLLRILEIPPSHDGLYVCGGRFVSLAAKMGWPINHLTGVLNERNGPPIRYWRVGTRLGGGEGKFIWPAMRDGEYASIGWPELGDLSSVAAGDQVKDAVRSLLEKEYPRDAATLTRKAGEIRNFISTMQEGDVILAADGEQILGVGRVTGSYRYEETDPTDAPHRRPVKWNSTDVWKLPKANEGLRTTVFPIGKHPDNIVEIERRLLASEPPDASKPARISTSHSLQLDGIPGKIQVILERKGQAIVYGPPGTGKTHWARQTARDLAAIAAFGRLFSQVSVDERAEIEGTAKFGGLVRWCTFHPAYGYEDFIEGFRPQQNIDKQLIFEKCAGIFKRLCDEARNDSGQRKYFLVVDEINRGDIPRIFGELLTLLEKDKRGLEVTLPISGDRFSVPKNVHLIGTMNTADRSIALLDTALRRRFGFVELMPNILTLGTASAGGSIPLGLWLAALNDRLRAHLGRDARNLQIGHAYLLENGVPVTDFGKFVQILSEDIVPLLEEYCYEDYGALAQILGLGLVDEAAQRIRQELFSPGKRAELVQALLEPAPDILTASSATNAAEDPDEEIADTEEAEA